MGWVSLISFAIMLGTVSGSARAASPADADPRPRGTRLAWHPSSTADCLATQFTQLIGVAHHFHTARTEGGTPMFFDLLPLQPKFRLRRNPRLRTWAVGVGPKTPGMIDIILRTPEKKTSDAEHLSLLEYLSFYRLSDLPPHLFGYYIHLETSTGVEAYQVVDCGKLESLSNGGELQPWQRNLFADYMRFFRHGYRNRLRTPEWRLDIDETMSRAAQSRTVMITKVGQPGINRTKSAENVVNFQDLSGLISMPIEAGMLIVRSDSPKNPLILEQWIRREHPGYTVKRKKGETLREAGRFLNLGQNKETGHRLLQMMAAIGYSESPQGRWVIEANETHKALYKDEGFDSKPLFKTVDELGKPDYVLDVPNLKFLSVQVDPARSKRRPKAAAAAKASRAPRLRAQPEKRP